MSNFEEQAKKSFDRMFKLAAIGIITMWVVGLAVLGCVGYVAYKILVHFGILG